MEEPSESKSKAETRETNRRKWSMEDRRRVVEASMKGGTTVDAVARVYRVNPSQIYEWRKQYRQGLLGTKAGFVPVQVVKSAAPAACDGGRRGSVLVEMPGAKVTLSGDLDSAVIRAVLECLAR